MDLSKNTQHSRAAKLVHCPSFCVSDTPRCLSPFPLVSSSPCSCVCSSLTHSHPHKPKETLKLVAERNIDATGDKSWCRDLHIDRGYTPCALLQSSSIFSFSPSPVFSFSGQNVKGTAKVNETRAHCQTLDILCPKLGALNDSQTRARRTKREKTCTDGPGCAGDVSCAISRHGTNLTTHMFAPLTHKGSPGETRRKTRIKRAWDRSQSQRNSPQIPHTHAHISSVLPGGGEKPRERRLQSPWSVKFLWVRNTNSFKTGR